MISLPIDGALAAHNLNVSNKPNTSTFPLFETQISASNEFLSPAKLYSEVEIQEYQDSGKLDMNFSCDQFAKENFHMKTDKNGAKFTLSFQDGFPNSLFSDEEKSLFQKEKRYVNGELKDEWIFEYFSSNSLKNIEDKPINQSSQPPMQTASSKSHTLSKRRICENALPQNITIEKLKDLINNQDTLFYTGAGLSAGAGVPSMDSLINHLGIKDHNFGDFFIYALNNPNEVTDRIKEFHNMCYYNKPSEAHWILKDLAVKKQTQILTENLDSLHEQTGIRPYRIHADNMRKNIDTTTLNQINNIVCVGLSYDDRGFLAWYKKHNPNGKIVSIDLKQPVYLGDGDYFLQGDLQEVLKSFL